MGFTKLQLNEKLLQGILDTGFLSCMPVQTETLSRTLQGKDVYVQSQTGTGKTAAFLVSIFQILLHDEHLVHRRALIIAPTRELAIQIEAEARLLGRHLPFTIGCFYGGVKYASQEKLLSQGVDIVVGTPGRLIDFNQQGKLNFRDVGILVIDEADRLFDMGFLPDIRRMLRKMPPATERRTMLFSATLDYRVRELAWEHMNDPVEIELAPENKTVDQVTQLLYHVAREEKLPLLLGILKQENPNNALIFTNTKHAAVEIAKRLEHNGYPCQFIMGDLPQSMRLQIMEDVKTEKVRFLVATEVAARGLHIDDLAMVINYDLPANGENYVHRIGRTARAGKKGLAISLACDRYVYTLEAIEAYLGYKIPIAWAEDTLYQADTSAGVRFERDKYLRQDKRGPKSRTEPRPARSERTRRKTTPPAQSPPPAAQPAASKKRARRRPAPAEKTRPAAAEAPLPRSAPAHARRPQSEKKSLAAMSDQERIEYYRRKYGEQFGAPAEPAPAPAPPAPKPSLLKKLLSLFTRA
jgi:ATP-dependent RNA helicase RhlB